MNRRGVALAADSAVTLGNGTKVYHTAEKLFSLLPSLPVGIMTFGAADMMGVPWEVVIKMYALKLGAQRFDTLAAYANDLLGFIEGSRTLFPEDAQRGYVVSVVSVVWTTGYLEKMADGVADGTIAEGDPNDALAAIIGSDHALWSRYRDMDELGEDYGAHVLETYSDVLDELEGELFGEYELNAAVRGQLRETVRLMFCKEWMHPADESGLVIAGMGESEPFAHLLQFRVGTIAAGKLRHAKVNEAEVGESRAVVTPFGQREIIDMIIDGIHPALGRKLIDDVASWLPVKEQGDLVEATHSAIGSYLGEESDTSHTQPFMASVAALPRQDLAKMAEALVSLTAFLMRMSADKNETVAEPIDVAVLSKGDGFTWVKHKDLLQQAGRLVGI